MHYMCVNHLVKFWILIAILAVSQTSYALSEAEITAKLKIFLNTNEPTVFITDITGPINSFDPMDAVQIVNMRPMLSLYARAVEFSETGSYHSSILRRFSYDSLSSSIIFELKRGLFFADGSEITVHDLAFMIARVSLRMHKTIPYQYIAGIDRWLKRPTPLGTLPSGIQIDEAHNRVIIKFTQNITNPFYRFTMALNSIIPKKCVDLVTNKLTCEVPPFSGDYALSLNQPPFYELSRRPDANEKNIPAVIRLVIIKMSTLFPYVHLLKAQHVIISSSPHMQPHEEQKIKSLFRTVSNTETDSFGLLMNTASITFKDERVRQFFAAEFRKTVLEQGYQASGSIFPTIYPGFMPLSKLESAAPFSEQERDRFIKLLKKHPPITTECDYSPVFFSRHLDLTLKRLAIPARTKPCPANKNSQNWLDAGATLSFGAIKLECLNPPMAIKMLFTSAKNIRWRQIYGDKKLESLLEAITYDQNAQPNLQSLYNVNSRIFSSAILAIVLNAGTEQFVINKSPLKFPGQFFLQTLDRFFSKRSKL